MLYSTSKRGGTEILMNTERKRKMKFTWGYESKIRRGFEQAERMTPHPHPANTHMHQLRRRAHTFCQWKPQMYCKQTRGREQTRLDARAAERRWRRGMLMTGRIPGWNKSHRKMLCDLLDLCKAPTHLCWGRLRWEFIKLTHSAHSHPTVQEHFSQLSVYWRM